MKKYISLIAILSLVWSNCYGSTRQYDSYPDVEELKKKYPDATIKYVTLEEYYQLKWQLKSSDAGAGSSYFLAENIQQDTDTTSDDDSEDKEARGNEPASVVDCIEDATTDSGTDRAGDCVEEEPLTPKDDYLLKLDYSSDVKKDPQGGLGTARNPSPPAGKVSRGSRGPNIDVGGSLDGLDGEAAVVIFIVIAVFAVFAVVYFLGKFIYDFSSGNADDYGYWFEGNAHASFLGDDGYITGFEFVLGLNNEDQHLGLAANFGNFNAKVKFREGDPGEHSDDTSVVGRQYVMVGPTFRMHYSESGYFHLDLLGGKTQGETSDVVGLTRAGFTFGSNHLTVGLSIGAMYLSFKDSAGYIDRDNHFFFTSGIKAGLIF